MSLIPWRPFWDMDEWFEEESTLLSKFENFPNIKIPKVDIYETKKDVVVEIELPGIDPKKITIEVEDNILRIEAGKEFTKEEKKKDYYKKEISSSFYKRVIPLPVEVIEEKADANYEDGILKVMIPRKKVEKIKTKKTQIKVKNKNLKK